MRTARRAWAATSSSWVMTTNVRPSLASVVEQGQHRLGVGRVEVACRLVAEQQPRRAEQRPRDRHALLLPARHLGGQEVAPVPHPDLLQRGLRAGLPVAAVARGVDVGEHHVLERGAVAEQMEGLEHEADAPRSQRGALVLAQRRGVDAVDQVGARGGAVEAPEDVEQRGLAGPGRPYDRDPVAGVDVEVDAAQRLHGRVAAVGAADAAQLHDRVVRRWRATTGPGATAGERVPESGAGSIIRALGYGVVPGRPAEPRACRRSPGCRAAGGPRRA